MTTFQFDTSGHVLRHDGASASLAKDGAPFEAVTLELVEEA